MQIYKLLAAFTSLAFSAPSPIYDNTLHIQTSSGLLTGFINSSNPSVHQFLGVPYSLPPNGSRRWLPPSAFYSNGLLSATNIGPACPQIPIAAALNGSVYVPNGGNETEFFPTFDNYSEDCLTLNVWRPSDSTSKKLPVFVWFFGGGFTQGGTNSLYFNPQAWVQRAQKHIVVTVNFRSNIFGFPNAGELEEQNLGLLDQRMGLEWVRDNIAAFGGDPSKIISWGESAGAIALDYLNFAYPTDPIVSGMIMDSGTAFFEPQAQRQTADRSHDNFTTVAAAFGCSSSAASQVECLRNVSWQRIEAFLDQEQTQKFTFIPVADNKTVFANYSQQYAKGAISPAPAIIGTNQHELNIFDPQSPAPGYQAKLDKQANISFLDTAAMTSKLRQAHSRTTYRFRYDGNFSNVSPMGFGAPFHAAELPLVFGTVGKYHGENTAYEDAVSEKMQDLWVAFANDPENGLKSEGWDTYGDGKAVLLGGSNCPMEVIDVAQLDVMSGA